MGMGTSRAVARRRLLATLPAVTLALLIAPQARAQSALASAAAASDDTGSDTIVVTASRSGDGIRRDLIGSSVTVIDAKALEDRQVRIVSDVLRDIPGIAVSRTGAVGSMTQVRVRGTEGNHVLVIVDGIKADDPFQSEFDWGTLVADDAARVEVLRGQQSSLYGSDAIGGVITYTTLSGREAPGIKLRAEGGSMGTYQGSARVAGASDYLDYAVSGVAQHTDGYAVAPRGTRKLGSSLEGFSGKANFTPSDDFKLTLVGRYNHARGETDNQAVPATNPPTILGKPVQIAVDTPGSRYTNRGAYGLARAEYTSLSGAMTTAASAQIADTERNGFGAAGRSSGDKGQRQRYSLENSVRLGSDALKHSLTVALDAEREQFTNTSPPSSFASTAKHVFKTYGVVGQYRLALNDSLGVGASVRHDWNDFFNDATTWHADASYLLPTATRLHAAAGTGVKNPGPFEMFGYSDGKYIGNSSLRPEKSKGWEAGVDQVFASGKARIGATYFNSRLHDEIYTDFPPPNFIGTSLNRTTTTHQQGVEVFAEARLGDFRADASYTYLDAPQSRNVLASATAAFGTPVEAQAVRRPKNIASLNITYAPAAMPFSATLTVRHNGKQKDVAFDANFNALYADLDAYTLVNLAATYDITPRIQLFGRVENAFDDTYQEVFGFATPGRAFYGGLRLKL